MENPRRGEDGQHASPFNTVNAQEHADLSQQGEPKYNKNMEPLLSSDPVQTSPQIVLALTPIIGVAYLIHTRVRRRYPRTLPTLTSLKVGELYGWMAMVPVASHYVLMKKTQVVQDKDLLTLEAFARHETMRLPELARWHAKHPNIAPSFNGESRDGSKRPVPAEPTFEWTHNHMWAPDSAYGFYCRKLYERFADKYPDISPQDWDICISYIAATAGGNSTPFNFLGYTVPFAMLARRWPIMLITPLLNGLQRGLFYYSAFFVLMHTYRHWAYPLTLQNKQRVAEMLREAYYLDRAPRFLLPTPPFTSIPYLRDPRSPTTKDR